MSKTILYSKNVTFVNNKAIVEFTNAAKLKISDDGIVKTVEIAGRDKVFYPVDDVCKIGNRLKETSYEV